MDAAVVDEGEHLVLPSSSEVVSVVAWNRKEWVAVEKYGDAGVPGGCHTTNGSGQKPTIMVGKKAEQPAKHRFLVILKKDVWKYPSWAKC